MTEHHCWRCGNCDADDELRLCDDCRESYLRVHAVPEPLTDKTPGAGPVEAYGPTRVAFAAGYEAAVRDFWRGVCEQMAAKADADAAMYSRRADDDAIAGHGYAARGARDDAAICRQGARQLRRWAGEP